ncbi:MAG: hypothetical protein NDJ90_10350 [Oligoflexia bacterium]|nr:hypothetical protein [Oligoflexia bacterium]
MTPEDLKTVAEIGHALWANPSRAEPITAETLSAVTLLDLTGERATERTARALLDRAGREGMAGNSLANLNQVGTGGNGFFRLFPEERFVLVALHLARWSYERVARVLGDTVEGVQAKAWSARVALVSAVGGPAVAYPSGAGGRGVNCPEYDPKTPWTQRFLDDEVGSGRERLFLQNHLMACDSCRAALSRCRDVYYAVEACIPRLDGTERGSDFLKALEGIKRRSAEAVYPASRSVVSSLWIFANRPDVRWMLLGAAGVVLYLLLQAVRGSRL